MHAVHTHSCVQSLSPLSAFILSVLLEHVQLWPTVILSRKQMVWESLARKNRRCWINKSRNVAMLLWILRIKREVLKRQRQHCRSVKELRSARRELVELHERICARPQSWSSWGEVSKHTQTCHCYAVVHQSLHCAHTASFQRTHFGSRCDTKQISIYHFPCKCHDRHVCNLSARSRASSGFFWDTVVWGHLVVLMNQRQKPCVGSLQVVFWRVRSGHNLPTNDIQHILDILKSRFGGTLCALLSGGAATARNVELLIGWRWGGSWRRFLL